MKYLQTFLAATILAVIVPTGPRDITPPTDSAQGCVTISTEVIGKELVETLWCCTASSSHPSGKVCGYRFRVTSL